MAAQRTLNPLIQVRILVPRPSKTKALSNQEESIPDRHCTSRALGEILCHTCAFVFNSQALSPPAGVAQDDLKDEWK